MQLFVHKDKHVVVAMETVAADTTAVKVAWVSRHVKSRGRKPSYDKAVPLADLVALDLEDVSEDVEALASQVLSEADASDAQSATDVAEVPEEG